MTRRLVACFLLLAVAVSAFPWEVLAAARENHSGQAPASVLAHLPSPPCPDPAPQGDPRGDGCLCPCCPAHALAPPVVHVGLSARLADRKSDLAPHADDLHPSDIIHRVFHPPRQA